MARRQLQIAGTERTDIPPEVDEAGEKWLELRKEKRRAGEREKEAKHGLMALMEAFKTPKFKHIDPDTHEEILLTVDLEPKLRAKKTGEAESAIGEAVVTSSGSEEAGPHDGLIAQAMKAQSDNGIAENAEGDVVVPDEAAPKTKRNKKGAKTS